MTIKKGENEHCSETDKLCGERISSYSKEGSNLLGSRSLIFQSRMHARLSVHPPVCLSVCLSVSVCVCETIYLSVFLPAFLSVSRHVGVMYVWTVVYKYLGM